MRLSKFLFLKTAALAVILICGTALAEESPESLEMPVTQGWMMEALSRIEQRLAIIEDNQEKILEGQAQLSEENKQLRYWIHRN